MATTSAQQRSAIDVLLNLVPDSPSTVLTRLQSQPELASAQDIHGYSLLHAAASYGHVDFLRALVRTYNVSPNIVDEDSETPLFAAETPEIAQCLIELGADTNWKNADGLTAEEKMDGEGDFPLVAAFLRQHVSSATEAHQSSNVQSNGASSHPPPLPNGVEVNIGTMAESEMEGDAPDPEIRRRIEELAARDDFQTEQGQSDLRTLITEVVGGIRDQTNVREVRRRAE